jgi:hypothetical protein
MIDLEIDTNMIVIDDSFLAGNESPQSIDFED